MRLTVHVTEAKKTKIERKDDKGKITYFERVLSTLSFNNIKKEDKSQILLNIEADGLGKPFKSYFSNDKATGHSKGPKKK